MILDTHGHDQGGSCPPGTGPPHRVGPTGHIEQVMCRFNESLAHHDVPADLRSRYRVHAERYLRWRANRADTGADRIQWRYYTQLRHHGATDIELGIVRTALALLRRVIGQPPRPH